MMNVEVWEYENVKILEKWVYLCEPYVYVVKNLIISQFGNLMMNIRV